MKRWRITAKVDGVEQQKLVKAETQKAARELVHGEIMGIERVIPNVVWRERYGFYFQATANGRRYFQTLETEDQDVAAERARLKLQAIQSERWADLERSKTRRSYCSLQEVVDVYRAAARRSGQPTPATIAAHVGALQRVVGGDLASQSAQMLDANAGIRYAERMLADCETLDRPARQRTIAAVLAHVRALVSPRMAEEYVASGLTIPREAWGAFRARFVVDVPRKDYLRPTAAEETMLRTAAAKLRETDQALWSVWLMSLYLGLRAREQAFVKWSWFRIGEDGTAWLDVVRREEEGFAPKGWSGSIQIHATVWQALQAGRGQSEYVLPGKSYWQRYGVVTDQFSGWMKGLGWSREKAAHELRKLGADEVGRRHGGGAADIWLRHAPRSVGERHYYERRSEVALELQE